MKRRSGELGGSVESGEVVVEHTKEPYKGNTGNNILKRVFLFVLFLLIFFMYISEHFSKESMRLDYDYKLLMLDKEKKGAELAHAEQLATMRGGALKDCPKCPECKKLVTSKQVAVVDDKTAKLKDIYEKRNEKLHLYLQDSARVTLKEKFGSEPYLVDLVLQLPAEVGESETATVRLEMAPAALMPVAVLYFLSLVSDKAWDGCSFIRNAGHVLQASNRGKKCDHKKFQDLHGEDISIAFQEYSPKYPHKKFTVGLAGRPGGPDFYFNLMDNSEGHGPGGQGDYAVASEADSCFAKILTGFDFIAKMHKLPIHPEDKGYDLLKHFVTIVSAKIVKSQIT